MPEEQPQQSIARVPSDGQAFIVSTSWSASIPTVHLAGEFDLTAAQEVANALLSACAVPGDVGVDLGEVTFIDVRGLNPVLRTATSLSNRGHHLSIVAASVPASRLLFLLGREALLAHE